MDTQNFDRLVLGNRKKWPETLNITNPLKTMVTF